MYCEVEGQPGVILIEAKANRPELSEAGMRLDHRPSQHSLENRERIGQAISEARVALCDTLPGICIDRDRHYQMSNRLAFAWKLASVGVPVVLLYIGFVGDHGIADVGQPFESSEEWDRIFRSHLTAVCPASILDGPVRTHKAPFWVLSRSRHVIHQSESRGA
jgi:hypothetical protein